MGSGGQELFGNFRNSFGTVYDRWPSLEEYDREKIRAPQLGDHSAGSSSEGHPGAEGRQRGPAVCQKHGPPGLVGTVAGCGDLLGSDPPKNETLTCDLKNMICWYIFF
jgi:hypothetical protein